ncbi:putative intraflagellar transport protein [Besnoitia besnoiti]|uniref:Putative intraflagellar transport protein n=1 Tax=Besnoitia besnoiti TaxID=94643 RepID=A0A2A9MA31_BESBE|nr:putative intraflagellar transport protein [Besnoitia besnoiti]PFH32230.1 putative intraflagellar transport protein [Besnoitia besnoiti]
MRLQHSGGTLLPSASSKNPVVSAACCASGKRMAVALAADRVVHLVDARGCEVDRFGTRPSDKSETKIHSVTAVALSPDSLRVAVAQSDDMVFVYHVGHAPTDKKAVYRKFPTHAPATSLVWPSGSADAFYYGLVNGRVRVAQVELNKSGTLFDKKSPVTCIGCQHAGNILASGHADGSVQLCSMDAGANKSTTKEAYKFSAAVSAIGFAPRCIAAASQTAHVALFAGDGALLQVLDFNRVSPPLKDISALCFHPAGARLVVAAGEQLHVFSRRSAATPAAPENNDELHARFSLFLPESLWKKASAWGTLGAPVKLEGCCGVSTLCWTPDGSTLYAGTLRGSVEKFASFTKKARWGNTFEFYFLSPSRVRAKRLSDRRSIVIEAAAKDEPERAPSIERLEVYQERFVVAHTDSNQVVFADIETRKVSTLSASWRVPAKFVFHADSVCLVHHERASVAVVLLGYSEIAGHEQLPSSRRAFALSDCGPVCLKSGGAGLIQERVPCFSHAEAPFLQGSSRLGSETLRYSVYDGCHGAPLSAEGALARVECSANGDLQAVLNLPHGSTVKKLNTGLIQLAACIHDKSYSAGLALLDGMERPWAEDVRQKARCLADAALADGYMDIAKICFASAGCLAESRFLADTECGVRRAGANDRAEASRHGAAAVNRYLLKAREPWRKLPGDEAHPPEASLSIGGNLRVPERHRAGPCDCQPLFRFDAGNLLAERETRGDSNQLTGERRAWLMHTGQEEKAGEVALQVDQRPVVAAEIFLRGGLPFRAAAVVASHETISFPPELLESVGRDLAACGLYEQAGDIFQRLGDTAKALSAYRKGCAFKKAVELARKSDPATVIELEEAWAQSLLAENQPEAAVNHFIEAGSTVKAIEASLEAKQWKKALQLLHGLLEDNQKNVATPFLRRLAKELRATGRHADAARCFTQAGDWDDAVRMYVEAGRIEEALQLAASSLGVADAQALAVGVASECEAKGDLQNAAKAFLLIEAYDEAIAMYRRHSQTDAMLKLVALHRPELLEETYRSLGEALEARGDFEAAEQFYTGGGLWKLAVGMYQRGRKWEDAMRVARKEGGEEAFAAVISAHAEVTASESGSDAAIQLLLKHKMPERAVEAAVAAGDFAQALKVAKDSGPDMFEAVNLRLAATHQDRGDFQAAERHFLLAGKACEAIEMYRQQHDWEAAMRVAEMHSHDAVLELRLSRAKSVADAGDLKAAEALFIEAERADLAVSMYLVRDLRAEALKISKAHCPQLLPQLLRRVAVLRCGSGGADELIDLANVFEAAGLFAEAIGICLAADAPAVPDAALLKKTWLMAVSLAETNMPDRLSEVADAVARKMLAAWGPSLEAAELLEAAGEPQEAVQCLVDCQAWEKARSLARAVGRPACEAVVREGEKKQMVAQRDLQGLLLRGETSAALEVAAADGAWETCLACARDVAPDQLPSVLCAYGQTLLCDERAEEAAHLLLEAAGSWERHEGARSLCRELVYSLHRTAISAAGDKVRRTTHAGLIKSLLMRILARSRSRLEGGRDAGDAAPEEIRCIQDVQNKALAGEAERPLHAKLLVAHYLGVLSVAETHCHAGTRITAAKTAVALLRYARELRPDDAFYRAGLHCKAVGWSEMAFWFLNRYLDTVEAIEDSGAAVGGADSEATDIPPLEELSLPGSQLLPAAKTEEAREWVLDWSVCQGLSPALRKRECRACREKVYEASMCCSKCGEAEELCVVTGYPVDRASVVQCTICRSRGNACDWAALVSLTKECPWCGSPQAAGETALASSTGEA